MKTSELTGAALDWAVAKCENYINNIRLDKFKQWQDLGRTQVQDDDYTYWNPSTDWAQAGPIIEREIVSIDKEEGGKRWAAYAWRSDRDLQKAIGPTLLIAAMRCLVASRLGDEVEIPEELK